MDLKVSFLTMLLLLQAVDLKNMSDFCQFDDPCEIFFRVLIEFKILKNSTLFYGLDQFNQTQLE